jgi:regulator of sigma E protease
MLTAKAHEIAGYKIFNLDPIDHPVINTVVAGKPAELAGLKAGDEFRFFGGVPVVSQEQLVNLIHKRSGEATTVMIKRDSKLLTLSVTPGGTVGNNDGQIGVMLSSSRTMTYELQHPLPWDQISSVWNRTMDTIGALFHSKQTGVGIKDLSGPPGILMMLAAQVNADYRLALNFLVLLNINLAILNLLPMPVLDGGHILMSIIEKIRRRPLNVKFVEYMTTGFAVLLISFILFVSFNDFKRGALFKSMFQHSTKIESVTSSNDLVESAK